MKRAVIAEEASTYIALFSQPRASRLERIASRSAHPNPKKSLALEQAQLRAAAAAQLVAQNRLRESPRFAPYFKMRRLMIPDEVIRQLMASENFDPNDVTAFFAPVIKVDSTQMGAVESESATPGGPGWFTFVSEYQLIL